jgi:4a-hydroxytetrahydrobiopterin dehydratase
MTETLAEKTCTPCRGGVPALTPEEEESEGHHPDIGFGWGYATVSLRTKKIKGPHENDFIMAVKIDRLASV